MPKVLASKDAVRRTITRRRVLDEYGRRLAAIGVTLRAADDGEMSHRHRGEYHHATREVLYDAEMPAVVQLRATLEHELVHAELAHEPASDDEYDLMERAADLVAARRLIPTEAVAGGLARALHDPYCFTRGLAVAWQVDCSTALDRLAALDAGEATYVRYALRAAL